MDRNNSSYIVLTVVFKFEDDVWAAECKELGTATLGETIQEAESDIQEAILLHLNTLEQTGEQEAFFLEHGIRVYSAQPQKMHIDLPFDPNVFVTQKVQPFNQMAFA